IMPHGNANIDRVNLTKYVRVGSDNSGKWRFCPVARAGNGRVRPDHVLVDGKRHRESAGKNPTEAWAAARDTDEQSLQRICCGASAFEMSRSKRRIRKINIDRLETAAEAALQMMPAPEDGNIEPIHF